MNTDRELLPGYNAAEVAERVSAAWAFRLGWIPWPRFVVRCPCCYAGDAQLQRISFGRHEGTIPGRADVTIKCCKCSHLWAFGVPVSAEVYERALAAGKRSWEWREIAAKLEEEGAKR